MREERRKGERARRVVVVSFQIPISLSLSLSLSLTLSLRLDLLFPIEVITLEYRTRSQLKFLTACFRTRSAQTGPTLRTLLENSPTSSPTFTSSPFLCTFLPSLRWMGSGEWWVFISTSSISASLLLSLSSSNFSSFPSTQSLSRPPLPSFPSPSQTYEVIGQGPGTPSISVPTHFSKIILTSRVPKGQNPLTSTAPREISMAGFVLPNAVIPDEVPLEGFLVLGEFFFFKVPICDCEGGRRGREGARVVNVEAHVFPSSFPLFRVDWFSFSFSHSQTNREILRTLSRFRRPQEDCFAVV